jgi:hypothetical protein
MGSTPLRDNCPERGSIGSVCRVEGSGLGVLGKRSIKHYILCAVDLTTAIYRSYSGISSTRIVRDFLFFFFSFERGEIGVQSPIFGGKNHHSKH